MFDIWRTLGRFDTAISNPPFGRVNSHGKQGPSYNGSEFEYKIIDIAAEIADYGTFLIPQGSSPFRLSATQYYQRTENRKFQKFFDDTGIDIESGAGVDTSYHKDEWKTAAPITEIACCDFTERTKPGQMSLFDEVAA